MKTLLLMRHGKSDWDADYDGDHDRPLNDRGMRSAQVMGRLLSGLDLAPDYVITSTALRARTTAELAADAGDWDCVIALEPGFYGADHDEVLALASAAPNVDRLMLIGHEPTWSAVIRHLTGSWVQVKTATVAVVELDTPDWSSLPEIEGELTGLHHPRQYFGSEWDSV